MLKKLKVIVGFSLLGFESDKLCPDLNKFKKSAATLQELLRRWLGLIKEVRYGTRTNMYSTVRYVDCNKRNENKRK